DLRRETDRVLDIDLKGDTRPCLTVELPRFRDALEDASAQVLLDDEKYDVAMTRDVEPEERFLGLQSLAASARNDRSARGAGLSRGLQDRPHLGIVGQGDQQLKLHDALLSSANSGICDRPGQTAAAPRLGRVVP